MMLSIFLILVGYLYLFFGELILILCLFLNWIIFLLNCKNFFCVCILEFLAEEDL